MFYFSHELEEVSHAKIEDKNESTTKIYKCPICRKKFNQKQTLENHMFTHTTEKPFSCHVCERSFCSKSSLNHHAKNHGITKPLSCGQCSKTFLRYGHLRYYLYICSISHAPNYLITRLFA